MPPGVLLVTSSLQVLEPGVAPDFAYSEKQSSAFALNANISNMNAAIRRPENPAASPYSLCLFIFILIGLVFLLDARAPYKDHEEWKIRQFLKLRHASVNIKSTQEIATASVGNSNGRRQASPNNTGKMHTRAPRVQRAARGSD